MSGAIDPRLQRLLGGEHRAALRQRLRRHYERATTSPDDAPTPFRLTNLSRQDYDVLASLMGRPSRRSSSIEVDVTVIDAALSRAGIAPSLRSALERLDGPIVHAATARAEAQLRWSAVIDNCRHPWLAAYLQTARGAGLLKRLAAQDPDAGARLRDRALAVLQRLLANGLPRAQLAAETLGDAHALDAGRPTATLVLAVLRHTAGASDATAAETWQDKVPDESARSVWARFGVLVNELARPALFLNLPTEGGASFMGAPGEPAYASLRTLLRASPALSVAGHLVYVCENPNVVAIAADRLGAQCEPLVCTDGMPAAAQRTLLAQLARAGARLKYHGDFDWPGVRIANYVMRTFGAEPWRLSAEDYAAAVDRSEHRDHRLTGGPIQAAWDAHLAPVMRARGVAIAEETVAEVLLRDVRL